MYQKTTAYKLIGHHDPIRQYNADLIGYGSRGREKAIIHYRSGGTVMVGEAKRYARHRGRWSPWYVKKWRVYNGQGQ